MRFFFLLHMMMMRAKNRTKRGKNKIVGHSHES
jgi:hypothetical protein